MHKLTSCAAGAFTSVPDRVTFASSIRDYCAFYMVEKAATLCVLLLSARSSGTRGPHRLHTRREPCPSSIRRARAQGLPLLSAPYLPSIMRMCRRAYGQSSRAFRFALSLHHTITHHASSASSPSTDHPSHPPQPAVETAVTRLLVSIKQLLEALTKWSNQEATEGQVSDVYVRLGNDFNGAVSAFASYNIDMSFVRLALLRS